MNSSAKFARAFLLLTAALLVCACARVQEPHPAAVVVQALYAALEADPVSGAPSAEELDALAPWLGNELERLLARARAVHDLERARVPEDKPPFNDGDLFSSLFEGPTGFQVGAATGHGSRWRVPVAFTYAASGSVTEWTDIVVVEREGAGWVVVDVAYGGDWDFALRGSLAENLRADLATLSEAGH